MNKRSSLRFFNSTSSKEGTFSFISVCCNGKCLRFLPCRLRTGSVLGRSGENDPTLFLRGSIRRQDTWTSEPTMWTPAWAVEMPGGCAHLTAKSTKIQGWALSSLPALTQWMGLTTLCITAEFRCCSSALETSERFAFMLLRQQRVLRAYFAWR